MSVLLTRRWVALHLLAAALVTACLALTWWQFGRAQDGNTRSFGYAFQWPAFALFTVGVWAWLCRDATRSGEGSRPTATPAPGRIADEVVLPPLRVRAPAPTPDDDPELAAYNRMLARLAEAEEE